MSGSELHTALLRPAVIQILKAAGFTITKPAVVDSLTDLTGRYLLLLAEETAAASFSNGDRPVPTIQDVRVALTKTGALRPQMSAAEEAAKSWVVKGERQTPFEDLRGVNNFINFFVQGSSNKEIRRIAGLTGEIDNLADLAAGLDENEDYLTALKKKHGKSAEESRYQGTTLGKEAEMQPVTIAGGPVSTIAQWSTGRGSSLSRSRPVSDTSSAISSALSTPAAATPEVMRALP